MPPSASPSVLLGFREQKPSEERDKISISSLKGVYLVG